MDDLDRSALAKAITSYWFATLDDGSRLEPGVEPFPSCFLRWYGKRPEIDAEIRSTFEPALDGVLGRADRWEREVEAWAPHGLLPLVVLLDQLPRNMYRGTARMYARDPLALATAEIAIARYEQLPLPLVQRMFLYVPLLHVEDLGAQERAVALF